MTFFPCPNGFRTCTAICRSRGCHVKCKTYQEQVRLPRDMAAWCRLVSLCGDRDDVQLETNPRLNERREA